MELDEETATMAVGTFWSNLGVIAVKLVSFIYMILIARLVAQSEVGLFYLGIGMMGVVSIFADLGISQTVQRYLPYFLGKNDKASARRVLALNIFLGLLPPLIVAFLVWQLAPAIANNVRNPGLEPLLAYLAIYLFVNQVFNILLNILVALKKMKERSVGTNLQNVLKVVFTLLLVWAIGPQAATLSIAFILSLAAGAIYLLYVAFGVLKSQDLLPAPADLFDTAARPLLLNILPFGLTMLGVSMFSLLISYMGVLALGYLLGGAGNASIGIYSMATAFAAVANILAASVITIFLPVASGLVSKTDSAKITKTAQTALRWVLFSTIPVVAFLAAFAPSLLRVLYGADYESGALTLSLFSIGTLLYYLGSVQGTLIAAHRFVKLELIAFLFGALANVILNFALIPIWGINGAAFASLASFGIIAAVNHYFARKKFGFSIPTSAWKNLFCGFLLLALLAALHAISYDYLVHLPIPLPSGSLAGMVLDKVVKVIILGFFMGLGCLAYLVLLNLFGLFEDEDRSVMKHLLDKMKLPAKIKASLLGFIFWGAKKD